MTIITTQQNKLIIANKDLEQFAYMVSHDLKAPLKSIYSFVGIIQDRYSKDFDGDLKKMFGFVESKTKNMDKLVSSILTYSRSGESVGKIDACNLRALILEVIDSHQIPQNIQVILPNKLPTIKTNKIQLSQVFSNLIGNAVKYGDKENSHIEIRCETDKTNYLKFSVVDNGAGITPLDQEKIFNVFETAHNSQREDSTGIGLAIVKKLVQLYRGTIGVASEIGIGSTFWFTWPTKVYWKTNDL